MAIHDAAQAAAEGMVADGLLLLLLLALLLPHLF
jgi:hypothetical protein